MGEWDPTHSTPVNNKTPMGDRWVFDVQNERGAVLADGAQNSETFWSVTLDLWAFWTISFQLQLHAPWVF
jgi:hypothetical protein